MTPRVVQPLARMSATRFVALLITACTLAASFAAAARAFNSVETRQHADSTYVHNTSFDAFRQGVAAQRSLDSSARAFERFQDRQTQLSIDSNVKCLRRFTQYCR